MHHYGSGDRMMFFYAGGPGKASAKHGMRRLQNQSQRTTRQASILAKPAGPGRGLSMSRTTGAAATQLLYSTGMDGDATAT